MSICRHLYAIAAIGAVLTAASFGTGHAKAAPPNSSSSNVIVTNTTAQPVPTAPQGTTQVAGTVGLSNGTAVGINNNSANPVPVIDVASDLTKTPVGTEEGFDVTGNSGATRQLFTVPAGKLLVIQTEYVFATLPTGQNLLGAQLDMVNSGLGVMLNFEARGDNGIDACFSGQSNGIIYVKAGDTVNASCGRSLGAGTASFDVGFQGYLVDAQ